MKLDNQIIAKHRKKEWLTNIKGTKLVYTRREYKEFIRIHHKTLLNYLKEFRWYLVEYLKLCSAKNSGIIVSIWGLKERRAIHEGKLLPSIMEILKLFHNLNLKKDFGIYLINKTHLSYDVSGRKIECMACKQNDKKRVYYKFAEFVYLILSEYIILHNKMWSSGLKLKGIKSVDKWLKDFT